VELVQEIGEESGVDNPVIVAPYDTELFGHWWAEGIDWLCEVIELISVSEDIEMTTTGDYLKQHPPNDEVQLQCSSWGMGGDDRTWLNEKTEWVNNLIKESEKEIFQRLKRYGSYEEDETCKALFEEALRELAFMQASDWTYLMTTGEAEDYSAVRISNHYYAFKRILNILDNFSEIGELKNRDVAFVESLKNNSLIFPHIEPEFWI
jgi:1,4-alpha-glucan branching enzyme